jgi:hypothetical protein
MISWVLKNVDIPTRTIFNSQKVAVGSFQPEHLQLIYKLSTTPNFICNVSFLVEFDKKECAQYVKNLPDLIKDWYSRPEKLRADSHDVYKFSALETHILYIAMMMCRLYKKENTTHFFLPWVPIMHTVAEGYYFDWAKIFSDSLVKEIVGYQSLKYKRKPTQFFMSAYIMEAVFFMTPFPLMGWSWTPTSAEPIHIYHSKIWEDKEKDFFYEIYNWVVVSIHTAIYGYPPPRISKTIVTNLCKIIDCYVEENFSYIMVFGCSVPPQALPQFFPDELVCCEVAHQTVLGGISMEFKEVQKKVWPSFPLQIGTFSLLDFGHSKVEAMTL